jgi:hypothetical protein
MRRRQNRMGTLAACLHLALDIDIGALFHEALDHSRLIVSRRIV